MSEKMFTEKQLKQLRSFPHISREDLIKLFTLTPADQAFVNPGRGRGPTGRLGMTEQLSTLPWLGFVPDEVVSAPLAAVARVAEQLGLNPAAGSHALSPMRLCRTRLNDGSGVSVANPVGMPWLARRRQPGSVAVEGRNVAVVATVGHTG
ncbi:DUF4158 domain-containing protein [Micromonospora sp. NPDC003197]